MDGTGRRARLRSATPRFAGPPSLRYGSLTPMLDTKTGHHHPAHLEAISNRLTPL
jgi:hypothetical protein